MKCTAHSTLKARVIVKDACVINSSCCIGTITIFDQPTIVRTFLMLLPMFWLETLDRLLDRSKIFFVNEVSTITATTLLQLSGIVVENSLAA